MRSGSTTALGERVTVELSGATVAPGVPAAALVVAAAAVALTLVGRGGRLVVALLTVLAGVAVVGSVVGVVSDPGPAAVRRAGTLTGVERLTEPVALTAWPWVAALLGVAATVWAVRVARLRSDSTRSSRRFERPAPSTASTAAPTVLDAGDDHDTWDALTRGEDPTENLR